jgi:predicted kinase
VYVVVTGPPASGKSTLARAVAGELGLPLLAKDTVKQALLDVWGAADVEASKDVGRAAVAVLLAVARDTGSGVLDSVWVDRARARVELAALPDLVELFCRVDVETMRARYETRSMTKGAGHFDDERSDDELWPAEAQAPLDGGWPVLEVDTTGSVDVPALVVQVRDVGRARRRRSRR